MIDASRIRQSKPAVVDWARGHCRIHPVECILTFPEASYVENVFIKMIVNESEFWTSPTSCYGGKDAKWGKRDFMKV